MKKLNVFLILALSALALDASAAVPNWATTMLTEAVADVATIGAAVGAVVFAIIGLSLTFKVVKRMVAKI